VRLVEVRLLDGPNIYRLEPTVRIELTIGRRRSWFGQRIPPRHAVVRLGAVVRTAAAPSPVGQLAGWVRRLHRAALGRPVQVTIHKTSEPGHWVVCFPWRESEKAETIAEAAYRLVENPSERLFQRALRRIAEAGSTPPAWIRTDEVRPTGKRVPLISISGTNGKSTTTRMLTHMAMGAGMHVGTTTTDGVLVNERMMEPGDFTGPMGARAVLTNPELDMAVLETARGGILLRGLGYDANDASVLTNVSADHLDLQGLHTLPELVEVKSVICRVTRPKGTVVLNADDALVAAVSQRVKARVFYFSLKPGSARIRSHLRRGGTAFVLDDGWLVEASRTRRRRIIAATDVPATLGGLARHNVANALAAIAGARALRIPYATIAGGLRDFHNSPELMPGRLNLYRRANRLVIIDYAHNEAGLMALLDTAEGLIGRRGRRRATLSAIIGAAGDRPDDALRAVGRLAAERADEVALKEDLPFLRGRTRQSALGELREGIRSGGGNPTAVPDYIDEQTALRGELSTAGRLAADESDTPRVTILMCHAHREEVADFLAEAGFEPVRDLSEVASFRSS
jgi:cyanophycin synthetase